MAGSDSELARAGADDAVGRCEEDVDVSVETGCADDGVLVGAGECVVLVVAVWQLLLRGVLVLVQAQCLRRRDRLGWPTVL